MNKELIEKLRNGEIALRKGDNYNQTKAILIEAFPDDSYFTEEIEPYMAFERDSLFWACRDAYNKLDGDWISGEVPNLPTVPASEFFKEEQTPKLGDVVFVRDEDDKPWNPYVFVLDRGEGFEYRYGTCDNILDKENEQMIVTIEFYRQMSTTNIKEVTIKEVTIEEAEEKFNIKIKR